MADGPNIARIGALLGDTARARMLSALMAGKALSASELADAAGISRATASSHLARLEEGGLLLRRHQGRHRYFCLAGAEVAELLEKLMGLSARVAPQLATGPKQASLCRARICYNHLAGRKGVQLHESLLARAYLFEDDGTLRISDAGEQFFVGFGIDLDQLRSARAPLCRECLDWSERRSHLAGSLGRALFRQFENKGWLERAAGSREVRFPRRGEAAFERFCQSG